MLKIYLAKFCLFLCAGLLLINLSAMHHDQLISFDSVLQIGLLMIVLELAICLKPSETPNDHPKHAPVLALSHSTTFIKMGLTIIIITFFAQCLIQ